MNGLTGEQIACNVIHPQDTYNFRLVKKVSNPNGKFVTKVEHKVVEPNHKQAFVDFASHLAESTKHVVLADQV